jgi:uncharacterized protein (DUF1778 family)
MAKAAPRKNERINLRTTEDQKLVIEQAAHLKQTTASEFMLQAAYSEALRVLEDASRIRLSREAWESFNAALDEPPKVLPGLKAFLAQPDVFD